MSSPIRRIAALLILFALCGSAQAENLRPAALKIIASNPVMDHPANRIEHTIRGLGRDVSPEYEIIHPTYTVQMSSWSGRLNHEHWNKFGRKKTISVGIISTLDAKDGQLDKLLISIPDMSQGYIIVPHHKNQAIPKLVGGEPHIRLELLFYSDKGTEIGKWLVESSLGRDNGKAKNWNYTEVTPLPGLSVSAPGDLDRCDGIRGFIVRAATQERPGS